MSSCKVTSKILPAAVAWFILLGCTGLFFAFTCPFFVYEYSIGIAIYQSILTIIVISNFGFSTFMDPGVYPKASNELVKDGELPTPLSRIVDINSVTVRMKWCQTCKFFRPPRSSHCSVCDCCIEVFDHHCPWVNNCVGRRNYKFFIQFLFSLTIHIVSIFSFCLVFVLHHRSHLKTIPNIVSMCLMGISGLLFIPIFGLTCFHIYLISRGRTTNEQVTGKLRGTHNPFDLGCPANCCYLFYGPTWPKLQNRKLFQSKDSKFEDFNTAQYNTSENVVRIYMQKNPTHSNAVGNKQYSKMVMYDSSKATQLPPQALYALPSTYLQKPSNGLHNAVVPNTRPALPQSMTFQAPQNIPPKPLMNPPAYQQNVYTSGNQMLASDMKYPPMKQAVIQSKNTNSPTLPPGSLAIYPPIHGHVRYPESGYTSEGGKQSQRKTMSSMRGGQAVQKTGGRRNGGSREDLDVTEYKV